jgi:isoamylase
MSSEHWADKTMRCLGMLMDGRARPTGVRQRGTEATLLLILNAHHDLVRFALPQYGDNASWRLLIDTNVPDKSDEPVLNGGATYDVTGRSLLLFVQES